MGKPDYKKIPMDKYVHFFVCALITVYFSIMFTWWVGIGACVVAAYAKEVYDCNQPGDIFDWSDIIADNIGMVFGLVLYIIFRAFN